MQAQPPAPGSNDGPDGQQDYFCPNCGGANPGSATVCKWCGQPIVHSGALPNEGTPPPIPTSPPWSQMPGGSAGQGPFSGPQFSGPSAFAPNTRGGCLRAIGNMLGQVIGEAAVESCCGLIGGIVLIAGLATMFVAGRKLVRRNTQRATPHSAY